MDGEVNAVILHARSLETLDTMFRWCMADSASVVFMDFSFSPPPPPPGPPTPLSISLSHSLSRSLFLSLSLSPSLFLFLYLSLSLSLALCFSHRWQETMETSCPCSCLKPFILYLSCLRAVGELKIVQDPEVWWSRNNVTTRTRCQSSLFLPERQSSWGNTGGRRLWQ